MANGSQPFAKAILATARTAAFIPGASPPEVITPMRFFLSFVGGEGERFSGGTVVAADTDWAIVAGFGGAWRLDEKG
jgi:hypothetical protein